jgi:hypothetical protein
MGATQPSHTLAAVGMSCTNTLNKAKQSGQVFVRSIKTQGASGSVLDLRRFANILTDPGRASAWLAVREGRFGSVAIPKENLPLAAVPSGIIKCLPLAVTHDCAYCVRIWHGPGQSVCVLAGPYAARDLLLDRLDANERIRYCLRSCGVSTGYAGSALSGSCGAVSAREIWRVLPGRRDFTRTRIAYSTRGRNSEAALWLSALIALVQCTGLESRGRALHPDAKSARYCFGVL